MTLPTRAIPLRGRSPGLWAHCCLLLIVSVAACTESTGPLTQHPAGALGPGTNGRWTTTTPELAGLDVAVLADFESRIDAGVYGTISSLLVIRGGRLAYERYSGDWVPNDLHRVYSVTKSVTSLLVGIAVAEGQLSGVDQAIVDLFPEYSSFNNPSPAKAQITLEHVLHMRAGFEWDELSTNYTNGVNPTAALTASPDWTKHVLDLPLADAPGTRFAYNSGASLLMSAALANSGAGESAEAYASTRLFAPLGITDWIWSEGPGGLSNSGWGLHLKPRDMAAIGQMVLQGGDWEGVSLVPGAWLEASATSATAFTDGTGYGYQWWLGPTGSGTTSATRSMAAWGWGGQFIIVLPNVDMVIVTTAENYDGGRLNPTTLAEFGVRAVTGSF